MHFFWPHSKGEEAPVSCLALLAQDLTCVTHLAPAHCPALEPSSCLSAQITGLETQALWLVYFPWWRISTPSFAQLAPPICDGMDLGHKVPPGVPAQPLSSGPTVRNSPGLWSKCFASWTSSPSFQYYQHLLDTLCWLKIFWVSQLKTQTEENSHVAEKLSWVLSFVKRLIWSFSFTIAWCFTFVMIPS